MITIYVISWLLIFNFGQYGLVSGRFEKRFFDREKAVSFVENKPDSAVCMTFDSALVDVGIDTATEIIMLNYKGQK